LKPSLSLLQALIRAQLGLGLNGLSLAGSGLEAQPNTSLNAITCLKHLNVLNLKCHIVAFQDAKLVTLLAGPYKIQLTALAWGTSLDSIFFFAIKIFAGIKLVDMSPINFLLTCECLLTAKYSYHLLDPMAVFLYI
jgi:hypothetical protein